ncbi:hypothetical protein MTP99_002224 [Tenebrio molitor]|nr:hypothetical protein MTP99_002224 [Tenebrio molitor]
MLSYKLLFFLVVVMALFMSVPCETRECNRPKNSFENIKHVHKYLECMKSQVSTRYGKRAHPLLLGRLRPDLYNDYENNLQQLYDVLYADN